MAAESLPEDSRPPESTSRPRSLRTCLQCGYSQWLVGIGQGFRCFHPAKKPVESYAWVIPSRTHVCELFVEKPPHTCRQEDSEDEP